MAGFVFSPDEDLSRLQAPDLDAQTRQLVQDIIGARERLDATLQPHLRLVKSGTKPEHLHSSPREFLIVCWPIQVQEQIAQLLIRSWADSSFIPAGTDLASIAEAIDQAHKFGDWILRCSMRIQTVPHFGLIWDVFNVANHDNDDTAVTLNLLDTGTADNLQEYFESKRDDWLAQPITHFIYMLNNLNFSPSFRDPMQLQVATFYEGDAYRIGLPDCTRKSFHCPISIYSCDYVATIGLHVVLRQCQTLQLMKTNEEVHQWLQENSSVGETDNIADKLARSANACICTLLLDVSGTGKTKHLESLLSSNWGFYFIAGNLNATTPEDAQGEYLYLPKRDGHSLDVHWLWSEIQNYHEIRPDEPLRHEILLTWAISLLFGRCLVLFEFLSAVSRTPIPLEQLPRVWFYFQRSADRFSNLFRLLLGRSILDIDEEVRKVIGGCMETLENFGKKPNDIQNQAGASKNVYFCFDEAQCDLDAIFTSKDRSNQLFPNIPLLLRIITAFDRFPLYPFALQQRFILSGTSLKLNEMQAAIGSSHNLQDEKLDSEGIFLIAQIYSDLPLLQEDSQMLGLLEERDFGRRFGLSQTQMNAIALLGRPLRGRYRWSVLYADKLDEMFSSLERNLPPNSSSLSDQDLVNLAQATVNVVATVSKAGLRARLQFLHNQGLYGDLLTHLLDTVAMSYVFNQKAILENDNDLVLIRQGFARAHADEINGQKVTSYLVEHLAVEAAIEWFLEERVSLRQYLNSALNGALLSGHSGFGNIAEPFFAYHIGVSLSDLSLIGSNHQEDSTAINDLFATAERMIERTLYETDTLPPFDELKVVLGKTICSKVRESGGLELWDWLSQMRLYREGKGEEPKISFYRPDTNAGPDLVFVLAASDSAQQTRLIICSVQVKTGTISQGELSYAVDTTSLHDSYALQPERRALVRQELESWGDETIVLRILNCTECEQDLPREAGYYKVKRKSARTVPKQGPRHQEYFLFCKKDHTATLYGESFARRAIVMKANSVT